jgi:glucokinase
MTVVMDAWFGFQPEEVLTSHIAQAGKPSVLQVWCHAPPSVIGERYAARVAGRSGGHLGLDYVPELIALAARARPLAGYPAYKTDTTQPFGIADFMSWLESQR